MTLVFLDTETTGRDPDRHEIWDLAYAVDDGPVITGFVYHSLRHADPTALRMNGYWDRARFPSFKDTVEEDCRAALKGATLVAANPAFDAAFLRARWGVTPWHYRLFDIEAYAAGVLDWQTTAGMGDIWTTLTASYGYDIPKPDHSAAGDVRALQRSFYTLRAIRHDMTGIWDA